VAIGVTPLLVMGGRHAIPVQALEWLTSPASNMAGGKGCGWAKCQNR